MANTYSDPDFNIDTSVDEAGLVTLKGGALASTDNIYVAEGATVTLDADADLSLNKIYLGNNSGGTASTATGHLVITKPGRTVTFYDSNYHGGIDGEGTTSNVTITGASANRCVITNNTNYRMSLRDVAQGTVTLTNVELKNFNGMYIASTTSEFDDVYVNNSYQSIIFQRVPSRFNNISLNPGNANYQIVQFDNTYSAISQDMVDMAYNNLRFVVASAKTSPTLGIYIPASTDHYYQLRRSESTYETTYLVRALCQHPDCQAYCYESQTVLDNTTNFTADNHPRKSNPGAHIAGHSPYLTDFVIEELIDA